MSSDPPQPDTKLSAQALFDDICRLNRAQIASYQQELEALPMILRKFDNLRVKLCAALDEVAAKDRVIAELNRQQATHEIQHKRIKEAYSRLLKEKDELSRKNKNMNALFETFRAFLEQLPENDMDAERASSRTELMTQLLEGPKTPVKRALPHDDSADESDELLFDTSEDSIDDFLSLGPKKTSVVLSPPAAKKKATCSTIAEENEDSRSLMDTAFVADKPPEVKVDVVHIEDQTRPKVIEEPSKRFPKMNSLPVVANRMYSRSLVKPSMSKLEPERLDTRQHNFSQKKAFTKMNCIPCGKSIGFCSNCIVCVECRGVTHVSCKDKLARPCIPHVSGTAISKMKSMTAATPSSNIMMIHHFIQDGHRPCVPAILIHCCNEIDRRIEASLKTEMNAGKNASVAGLYRLSGTDRVVREWRAKILEAKNGIPNLTMVDDVNVLCGVVKLFLRDLFEPLVTTVLWMDFIRAADHVEVAAAKQPPPNEGKMTDSDYESDPATVGEDYTYAIRVLKRVILQLPSPNKDSVSFLFLHLLHVIQAKEVTLMDAKALSRIFAPTIVGLDRPRLITKYSSGKETEQQIMVMTSLFRIERAFWSGVLRDEHFDPFKDDDTNRQSLNGSILERKVSSSNLRPVRTSRGGKAGYPDLDILY